MWGQAIPPAGAFVAVAAGTVHSCAVRVNGDVACRGAGKTNGDCSASLDACGMSVAPAGPFVEVAVGYTNSCGMLTDGSVACWGSNSNDRSTPPAGPILTSARSATSTLDSATRPLVTPTRADVEDTARRTAAGIEKLLSATDQGPDGPAVALDTRRAPCARFRRGRALQADRYARPRFFSKTCRGATARSRGAPRPCPAQSAR